MTHTIDDAIRRLALWSNGDGSPDNDGQELRDYYIDKWGEDTITGLEDIFLADHTASGAMGISVEEINTSPLVATRLEQLLRTGELRYKGQQYRFHTPDSCPDAVLTGNPDIPAYDMPGLYRDNGAWADVCMPVEDWIRLMVTPFDSPPMMALTSGLYKNGVERVREGIAVGDTIPRGVLELDSHYVEGTTYPKPVDQEGRNRGVGAWLEGEEKVLGRIILNP